MKKYLINLLESLPPCVPETDGSKVNAEALYRKAGIQVGERPVICRLKGHWNGHRSGSFVIFTDDAMFVFDRP